MVKILIVEDEKPIADLLDMSLTAAGYSCDCLDNGTDAADAVEAKRYDLILLDVMLPGVDGFELMEYLAPLEIPVIFITARSAVKDRIKGLRLGADDYRSRSSWPGWRPFCAATTRRRTASRWTTWWWTPSPGW